MNFIIQRSRLMDSIQDVQKAVSTRTTIPILTGIKLNLTEEGLTLTGSDSDISIESFIPREENGEEIIEIKETGGIVLNAKFFSEIIRKLPTDSVEILMENQYQTIIRSGTAQFNLNGLDPDEYPRLLKVDEEITLTIPANLLKTIIRQTVFAVSTSETRPILTGVNWQLEGEQLICTATDSHRLAMRTAVVSSNVDEPMNVVIPGRSLIELSKILDDSTDPVQITMTSNQILFKYKHLLFYSRLLEGNYPDTQRLIPTEYKTLLELQGKEFFQAIDRASLFARTEKNNVVKLTTIGNNTIEISSTTPEIGTVVEQMEIEKIEGEELKISFSAKYMMEALRAIDGTNISIQFTGAMRPFIVKSVDDDTLIQLILPVRTF